MVFLQLFDIEDEDQEPILRQTFERAGFAAGHYDILYSYFGDLHREIEIEINSNINRIACGKSASDLGGTELRAIWNAIGDLRHGVHAKFVAIASGELARFKIVDFPEKLVLLTPSMVNVEVDLRDTEFVSDERLAQMRREICVHLQHALMMPPK